MFYFIRKIAFKGPVGIKYVQNPAKILELDLSETEQKQLQQYLAASQKFKYKMLTEFEENTTVPTRFFSNIDDSDHSFVCFGFENIYDYLSQIYHSDLNCQLEHAMKFSSDILKWVVSDLRVTDSNLIALDYNIVKKLWSESYAVRPVMPEYSMVVKL